MTTDDRPPQHKPSEGRAERVIKLQYEADDEPDPFSKGHWLKTPTWVVVGEEPFSEGAMRKAFHLKIVEDESGTPSACHGGDWVAKIYKDAQEPRETYYKDVQMQMFAKQWAAQYNLFEVPKRVDFVVSYVIEFVDRPGRPLMSVERYIPGVFEKHSNNVGGVNELERNTPQAFSHFTYEASKKSVLVCDIQGVGDLYTDPQIHSSDGGGYGKGNLGPTGIKAFLLRHKCNVICAYLGLANTNQNDQRLARQATRRSSSLYHDERDDVNAKLGTPGGGARVSRQVMGTPPHAQPTGKPRKADMVPLGLNALDDDRRASRGQRGSAAATPRDDTPHSHTAAPAESVDVTPRSRLHSEVARRICADPGTNDDGDDQVEEDADCRVVFDDDDEALMAAILSDTGGQASSHGHDSGSWKI